MLFHNLLQGLPLLFGQFGLVVLQFLLQLKLLGPLDVLQLVPKCLHVILLPPLALSYQFLHADSVLGLQPLQLSYALVVGLLHLCDMQLVLLLQSIVLCLDLVGVLPHLATNHLFLQHSHLLLKLLLHLASLVLQLLFLLVQSSDLLPQLVVDLLLCLLQLGLHLPPYLLLPSTSLLLHSLTLSLPLGFIVSLQSVPCVFLKLLQFTSVFLFSTPLLLVHSLSLSFPLFLEFFIICILNFLLLLLEFLPQVFLLRIVLFIQDVLPLLSLLPLRLFLLLQSLLLLHLDQRVNLDDWWRLRHPHRSRLSHRLGSWHCSWSLLQWHLRRVVSLPPFLLHQLLIVLVTGMLVGPFPSPQVDINDFPILRRIVSCPPVRKLSRQPLLSYPQQVFLLWQFDPQKLRIAQQLFLCDLILLVILFGGWRLEGGLFLKGQFRGGFGPLFLLLITGHAQQLFHVLNYIYQQQSSYYCSISIMSSSRLGSASRAQRTLAHVPAVDVLHRGLQRKMSVNTYQKAFPRLKICTAQGPNNSRPSSSPLSTDPEQARTELYQLKEDNKRMEESNQELRTRIRRESKLNGIYLKRMGDAHEQPEKLSLDRALEVRLLLQVEELQEQLGKKESKLEKMTRDLRHRKDEQSGGTQALMMQLYSIVTPKGQEETALTKIEEELKTTVDRGLALRDKKHRLHMRSKAISQQLSQVEKELTLYHDSHPQGRQLIEQSNESGIYGTIRPKNNDEVEQEVARMKKEYQTQELKMQESADELIKQKIELLKEIDLYQNQKTRRSSLGDNKW